MRSLKKTTSGLPYADSDRITDKEEPEIYLAFGEDDTRILEPCERRCCSRINLRRMRRLRYLQHGGKNKNTRPKAVYKF